MSTELKSERQPRNLRVAMISNCSIELLEKLLEDALNQKNIPAELWIGGFGQYRQLILDLNSPLYSYAPNIVLLYLDGEDLFSELTSNPFDHDSNHSLTVAQSLINQLESLVQCLARQLPETTLLINTLIVPSLNTLVGLEYNSQFSLKDAIIEYNRSLAELARRYLTTVVIDVDSFASWMGHENWVDPRLWYLARMRFSQEAAKNLAGHYAATIASRLGKIRKCLVVDLDNILWGGVIGEDGINGIRLGGDGIGHAFVEFQDELCNLYQKGILLAVCSKNNQEDVLDVFRHHPEMRLREEQFASLRINWNDKVTNIREIADELNIGLDSLVFIDDNPVERTWVSSALSEVFVPEWPEDPSYYKTALVKLEIDQFLKLNITREDLQRGEIYTAQAKRRALQTTSSSLEDFYKSLEMQLTIGRADSYSIPRIAQLTQKTNQFNLTTRRYTDAEITLLSQSVESIVYWVELDDRFGSSGIIGVMILRLSAEHTWIIDTFLLSCRAMGRTVENAMLGFVCQELHAIGATKLIGKYIPTPKNKPAVDVYKKMGFHLVEEYPDENHWELDLNRQKVQIPEWFVIKTSSLVEKENG
jgi:FkbH-like protein